MPCLACCEEIEKDGARLKAILINLDDNNLISDDDENLYTNTTMKYRLTYGDFVLDMYMVTWYYIAHSNYLFIKEERRKKFWKKLLKFNLW